MKLSELKVGDRFYFARGAHVTRPIMEPALSMGAKVEVEVASCRVPGCACGSPGSESTLPMHSVIKVGEFPQVRNEASGTVFTGFGEDSVDLMPPAVGFHCAICRAPEACSGHAMGGFETSSGIEFTSISLVSVCPYCGGGFDVPREVNGAVCNHPTRMQKIT